MFFASLCSHQPFANRHLPGGGIATIGTPYPFRMMGMRAAIAAKIGGNCSEQAPIAATWNWTATRNILAKSYRVSQAKAIAVWETTHRLAPRSSVGREKGVAVEQIVRPSGCLRIRVLAPNCRAKYLLYSSKYKRVGVDQQAAKYLKDILTDMSKGRSCHFMKRPIC
jgi:hypothetical protein